MDFGLEKSWVLYSFAYQDCLGWYEKSGVRIVKWDS